MKRLLYNVLLTSAICLAMCAGSFDGLAINSAHATRAISSYNEQITLAQERIAQIEIMGARIEKENSAVAEDGTIILTRYGFIDPAVKKVNAFLIGEKTKAAEGKVEIKAFAESSQKGLELENNAKGLKTLDGEKINISYGYELPTKAKSLIVEFNYCITSPEGQAYSYKARYYLEIY